VNRGFTLIELVIVIGLIGTISALGISRFSASGTSIANRIEAQEAVYQALQTARDGALHRAGAPSDTVEADLSAALDAAFDDAAPAVIPSRVTFSQGRDGGLSGGRTTPLEITIAPQNDPIRLCVYPESGRAAKETCP